MDILLFFVGLLQLLRGKLATTISIIFILCSTYLQLIIIDPLFVNVMFVHNVSDVGLLLYILFFLKVGLLKGFVWRGKIQDAVTVFLFFIVLNGIYDCVWNDTLFGDAVRFIRGKMLLTVVYIAPKLSLDTINRSFRQVAGVTILSSIILLVQAYAPIQIIHFKEATERGVKPPITSIIFSAYYLLRYWNLSRVRSLLFFVLCFLPIVLNLKMTYAVSVLLIVVVFMVFQSRIGTFKKVAGLFVLLVSTVVFLSVSDRFNERLNSTIEETSTISSGETSGNFSYRILHAQERYAYISRSTITAIRGIGYVTEAHFRKAPFLLGCWNEERGQVDQLDNGDILWSNVFVRIGLLGLLVYLYLFIKIIVAFYRQKKDRRSALWFSYLMVSLLFTSLGNDTMWYGFFFLYPILFRAGSARTKAVRV